MAELATLNELNAGSDMWRIVVRVLRKWNLYDKHAPKELFCINFLLVDEEGTKIQASLVKKIAHDRFNRGIHETKIYEFRYFEVDRNNLNYKPSSHPFRLTFSPYTVFLEKSEPIERPIPRVAYSFKPIPEILMMSSDECEHHLIDVFGFVKSMGSLEEFTKGTEQKLILAMQLADAEDNSIECVLFDKCAMDTCAAYQQSEETIIVAVLNLCRVTWDENKERQLTSSFLATRVSLNEDINEVKSLISHLKGRSTPVSTQFTKSMPTQRSRVSGEESSAKGGRITLDKMSYQKVAEPFYVECELMKLESRFGWRYDGCAKCASIPKLKDPENPNSPLWCSFCKRKPNKIEPKLKITYTVKDESDTALVTFWNTAALQLVKKTATQLIDELPVELKDTTAFPDDLNHQIGKRVILKLKRNSYNKDNPGSSVSVSECTHCEDLLQEFNAQSSQGAASSAAIGSSSPAKSIPSSFEGKVSQESSDIIPTVDLADEEIPLAGLAANAREVQSKTKRRTNAAKDGSGKFGFSNTQGERLLKTVKKEK